MTQTEGKKRLLDTRMVPAPSQGIIPERDLMSTPSTRMVPRVGW